MSDDGSIVLDVDHSVSWATTTPGDSKLINSPLLRIRHMKFRLKFQNQNFCYRLRLYRDYHPHTYFDLSVKAIVGTDVVAEVRTSVRNASVCIWEKSVSDVSKVIPDIQKREWLFKIAMLSSAPPKKEDAKPALMTLTSSMPSYHTDALSRDFSKLLDDGSSSDVEISCGGQVFKAHRIVLGIRSKVFASMLQSSMVEGMSGRVDIEDVDGDILGQFLRYLYVGVLPELNLESAKALYEVADKYAVVELWVACASFLCRGLTKDNACDFLVFSDRHSDRDFKNAVIQFIIREKIPRNEGPWVDFCNSHPKLAFEILNSCFETFFPT